MKKIVLHEAGSWEAWSEDRLKALREADNERVVGSALAFENDDFKIWQIHLPAKQNFHFHKHSCPYFWTILTSGKCIQYNSNGSIAEFHYEVGDTAFLGDISESNNFIHNIENIGDTTLVFTTVEMKKYKAPETCCNH